MDVYEAFAFMRNHKQKLLSLFPAVCLAPESCGGKAGGQGKDTPGVLIGSQTSRNKSL